MSSLTFIHLSDIHFRYGTSNTSYDLDDVIRHELLRDAERESEKEDGINGILVSGDIAFAGKADEYEIAYDWLNKLCERVECSINNIWTVPGNHDIDRSKITEELAKDIRIQLRQVSAAKINGKLRAYLEGAISRNLLFNPLEQYNIFAAKFGCTSSPDPLFWEHDLSLNDGSILRLRGINTTLISNEHDSDLSDDRKLILSTFQTIFKREDHVTYMTMCHHPLEWLRDGDLITDWFDAHARLQLFGHRHIQRIRLNGDNVRIASGAMHPDRNEDGWEPRYNFIKISVQIVNADSRVLRIEVNPRIWNDTAKEFLLDPLGSYIRELPLKDWQPAETVIIPTEIELSENQDLSIVIAAIKSDLLELEQTESVKEVSILNAGEKLTSRFLSLPHSLQMQIAQKLELPEQNEDNLPDIELYRRYFRRAKERKLLEKLWNEVENIYAQDNDEQIEDNPFIDK